MVHRERAHRIWFNGVQWCSMCQDKSGTIDAIELQDVLCKLGFSVNPLQQLSGTQLEVQALCFLNCKYGPSRCRHEFVVSVK